MRRSALVCLWLVLLLTIPASARVGTAGLRVHFIDVGQGDCALIDDGEFEVLIDGGTADSGAAEYIAPYVDGGLELVIATHAHADHVGGLAQVLDEYEVSEIIYSGESADTAAWRSFFAAAQGEGCTLLEDEDMTISLPHGELIIYEIFDGEEASNNNSVTALLRCGGVSVLFTGDSEEEAEELIGARVGDVDVFKAAHHGSSTSNSLSFLQAIEPEYVVISCGADNSYGHPHREALENFAAVGAVSYSTASSGTVVLTVEGGTYWFDTEE